MDALSSTDTVPGRRKRKITSVPAAKSNASTVAVVPPSPEDKKPTPPSVCDTSTAKCSTFYSDPKTNETVDY